MKVCTKCGDGYPATVEYFPPDKRNKNRLAAKCRKCYRKYLKKYHSTLNGHLLHVFSGIKRRCENPKTADYNRYGGRGIQNKFIVDEFIDYVINDLGYNTYEKIKGLWIDRINNNGHYEKGNIQFVTAKESNNNRRDNVDKAKRDC